MKRKESVLLSLAILFIMFPDPITGQGSQIPVTTVSDEARETFIIGRQKAENIQPEAALMLFDRAIELDPDFALAYVYRGQQGDFEKAMTLIDKVSEGEQLTIRYFNATSSFEYKEAKEYLNQLLEKFPSSKHVHLWAGLFYENILHNYQLALDHFFIATRIDENYAAPNNEMGYRYMRLGNYAEAEKAFRKYIELAPDCPNAFDSYANFLMKQKRYDESIRQYSEVYNLNPDKIVTVARIGQNYAFRGEYDEARSYYQKYFDMAESTGPRASAISLGTASFIAEGEISKALKRMKDYIKLGEKEKSNVDVILGTAYCGFINLELGDSKQGIKDYLKAAELLKTLDLPEPTRKRYSFSSLCWLSRAYAFNGDIPLAMKYLDEARAIVEETNNPLFMGEYHLFTGILETAKGNYSGAIDNLLYANRDDPYNIYTLARAYYLSGDTETAAEYLEVLDSWEDFGLDYAIARVKSASLLESE